jgi:hypothetical protein
MRTVTRIKFAVMLVVGVAATVGLSDDSQETGVRTWTSKSGDVVAASFVKVEKGRLHLKKSDGASISIPLRALCSKDQKLVMKLTRPDRSTISQQSPDPEAALDQKPSQPLSEDEIQALAVRWIDKKNNDATYRIKTSLTMKQLSEKEKKKYLGKRKIPYRILATIYRHTGNASRTSIFTTEINFYLLDSDGNIVLEKQTKSGKMMMPSGDWKRGGYFGEVAEDGKYTAVVWADLPNEGRIGAKLTTKLFLGLQDQAEKAEKHE